MPPNWSPGFLRVIEIKLIPAILWKFIEILLYHILLFVAQLWCREFQEMHGLFSWPS